MVHRGAGLKAGLEPSVGKKKIVVNVAGGEVRVAICCDGRLEELWVEHPDRVSPVGNIYKGRVTNVERALQAAFVDCGIGKEGFLHVTDVHPRYFPAQRGGKGEAVGKRTRRRDRPLIENCLKRGDEVTVQVTKDGFGRKGPALSTYLSIAGRTLVMLPQSRGSGVSRHVDDDEERRRLREMLSGLELPEGAGFILRTAGRDASKGDLQADARHLSRMWSAISRRMKHPAPTLLWKEHELATQVVRDRWGRDFEPIAVDDQATADRVSDYLRLTVPRTRRTLVEVRRGGQPIFEEHGIEADVEKLSDRSVPLPSGGSIVIDQTEALVAIDVNSGRTRVGRGRGTEELALKANLEAADEVARQLRLRDLGGLVVVDFIDMDQQRNRDRVTAALTDALASHKEKANVLPMNEFGLVAVTRQRSRASVASSIYDACPHCRGAGRVRSQPASVARLLRMLNSTAASHPGMAIQVWAPQQVVVDILNKHRDSLTAIESLAGAPVTLSPADGEVRITTTALASEGVPLAGPEAGPPAVGAVVVPAVADGSQGAANGLSPRGIVRRRRRRHFRKRREGSMAKGNEHGAV